MLRLANGVGFTFSPQIRVTQARSTAMLNQMLLVALGGLTSKTNVGLFIFVNDNPEVLRPSGGAMSTTVVKESGR